MPHIPLAALTQGPNSRRVPPSRAAEEGLESSIRARGLLQPLLARPTGPDNHLEIVIGSRRFKVAQKLGMIEIPVEIEEMTDAQVRTAQLIENMQRETMHPVDQWNAIREIMLDGPSLKAAAAELGMDERQIRRMEHLGRLNKLFLKLCEIEMPTDHLLRVIANAPTKTQQTVAKGKDLISQRGDVETVNWSMIAERCRVTRVSRGNAIFDVAGAKIAWDEDFFAQPGAADQFTTTEVDRFIALQTQALRDKVQTMLKAKKHVALTVLDRHGGLALPKGVRRVFDAGPDGKLKRGQTAYYAVATDGTIETIVAQAEVPRKASKTNGGGAPVAASEPDDDPDASPREDDDNDDVGEEGRGPITKEGQRLIALAKMAAVHKTLTGTGPLECMRIVQLLILALSCDNVSVRTEAYGTENFRDLATRLLEPGGNLLELTAADIAVIGQEALARILKFLGPKATQGANSGYAGETIGHVLNAEHALDRFDTLQFLQTVNAETLRNAALGAGMKPAKSAAALREQLTGKLPDWRPPGASFGAVAPRT